MDLLREIWQTLSNNKLRTALTGIAVAWGIFMLIVLTGMSRGVVNSFNENKRSQGANMLKVWGGVTTEAWNGFKEGRVISLKEEDMAKVAMDNPEQAASVTAELRGQSLTISTPKDYMVSSYTGVYPQEKELRAYDMVDGRFINDIDIREARKVMVLSKQSAITLFGDENRAVGNTVRAGDLSFLVVGVYDSEWGRTVYVPYSTAKLLAGSGDVIDNLTVELQNVSSEADGDAAETRTRQSLSSVHDFKADDESAIWVWNKFTQQLKMKNAMGILEMSVWLIGLFTLLSGIIGVSNIMFVSVKERTHEIGIRRAIGAKPRSILTQIITESVAITTLFGYIGIVAGTALMELIARMTESMEFIKNPRTDLSVALSVTVVLIIAGLLAGLFPALKALKVKPVEALRDE